MRRRGWWGARARGRRTAAVTAAAGLCLAASLAAQELAPAAGAADADPEREAVMAVVERLFDGMREGDSAAVRSVFHPEARLIRSVERDGTPAVQVSPIEAFIEAVGGAEAEWDEPIWDTEVRVEGGLATVWTRYAFYLGGEFSHCGVDAFILGRTAEGWKIVSLADTARREGCEEPPGR